MKLIQYVCLLLIIFFISGCFGLGLRKSDNERGNPINEKNIKNIVKEQTDTTEVIGMFGTPSKTQVLGKNIVYTYEHCKSGGIGVSVLGMGGSESKARCNVLTVTFRKEDEKVANFNWQKEFEYE